MVYCRSKKQHNATVREHLSIRCGGLLEFGRPSHQLTDMEPTDKNEHIYSCPRCDNTVEVTAEQKTEKHDCEKSAPPGFLTDGYRQDGEEWTCPDCKKVWVHVCDEAEGCEWVPKGPLREARSRAINDMVERAKR